MKSKFSYINNTLKFSIAGFFIPGFTLFIFFGPQMGLTFLGIECSNAWKVIWTLTAIGMLVSPVIFTRMMIRRASEGFHLTTKELTFFNILEYTFIQATLGSLFTNGKTLCYVSDGQNGIELIFSGWMAIPFLILISLFFDFAKEKIMEDYGMEEID